MTDESKTRQPKIENLELNKETIEDLTEPESGEVRGGLDRQSVTCRATHCCDTKVSPLSCGGFGCTS